MWGDIAYYAPVWKSEGDTFSVSPTKLRPCMDVQKERKSTFLTAFEHREKEACILFAAQYFYRSCLWMSLSSESSVSSTAPRYLLWLTDFRFLPPVSVMGWLYAFALLALNAHASHLSGRHFFGHNSPAAAAREVLKLSTDAASLLGSIKKFFDLGEGFDWEELANWGCFWFLTKFDWPWTPIQWTKILAQAFCGN